MFKISAVVAEGRCFVQARMFFWSCETSNYHWVLDDTPKLRNKPENSARPTFFGDMQQGIELWERKRVWLRSLLR
jgi:hypothetical protein